MPLQKTDAVFLSYASPDVATAAALAAALKRHVARVFFAPDSMCPGQSFVHQINDALRTFTVGIVIWSSHSAASRWVADELDALLIARNQRGAQLQVVTLDDTPVPALLSATQAIRTREQASAADVVYTLTGLRPNGALATAAANINVDSLDHLDREVVARALRRAASELIAGPRTSFMVTVANGLQLAITINTDGIEAALPALDTALKIVDALGERIQFLRQKMTEPISFVVDFERSLRAAQESRNAETEHIKPLMRVLVKECLKITAPET
jgi:hypothetical protein